MIKVFIDGSQGTTGLRLKDRLMERKDIELLTISEEERKSLPARAQKVAEADVAFLCLPDAASRELVETVKDVDTKIVDTSTAFRCDDRWAYGFPELGISFLEKIRNGSRISVPGCHASGSIAVIAPLVQMGLVSPSRTLTITSLTGYSGGGKKMIAEYEGPHDHEVDAPRIYALGQTHKHLPEIKKYTGLASLPIFLPIVAPYYSGMLVTVGIENRDHQRLEDIRQGYREFFGPSMPWGKPINIYRKSRSIRALLRFPSSFPLWHRIIRACWSPWASKIGTISGWRISVKAIGNFLALLLLSP